MTAADVKWLKKAEHWSTWLRWPDGDMHPDVEPEALWMFRGAGGVRFYGYGTGQHGQTHKTIMAAYCWAWANDWFHLPGEDWRPTQWEFADWIVRQAECRRWVLAGGADAQDLVGDRGVLVALGSMEVGA